MEDVGQLEEEEEEENSIEKADTTEKGGMDKGTAMGGIVHVHMGDRMIETAIIVEGSIGLLIVLGRNGRQ